MNPFSKFISFLALAASSIASPPNIVLILADDLGFGDVRALNPASKIPTPHLDRLAAEGRRFTEAHTPSSVCTPTRYGLLTGRYSWRTRLSQRVVDGYTPSIIEPGRLTVADLLRERGYTTACIGKWHLGMTWQSLDGGPIRNAADAQRVDYRRPALHAPIHDGFDTFWGMAASNDMPPYVMIENDLPITYPSATKEWQRRSGPAAPDFEAAESLERITRHATDWIAAQARPEASDRPFFLYLPITSPHTPILPSAAWRGRSGLGDYGDFVMETDDSVGQIIAALEKGGLAENTLIIVTSDNGASHEAQLDELAAQGHFANGPFRGQKADTWEGGHRVPFIVRWPGHVAPGTTSDALVSLVDFMATAAEITGAPLPTTAGEDSFSFLWALNDTRPVLPRDHLISHSFWGHFGIRVDKWKLILTPDSGGWSAPRPLAPDNSALPQAQLYDLAENVAESPNRLDEHPAVAQRLVARLERIAQQGRSTPGPLRPNDRIVDVWHRKDEPDPVIDHALTFDERVLPAVTGSGLRMADYWVWGSSVIRGDDGLYHMYASRWPKNLAFHPHWISNSEVVHAVSATPEGPYTFSDVALPPRDPAKWDGRVTHNPTIHKFGDTYLLFYIGMTYSHPMPTAEHPLMAKAPEFFAIRASQRIGVASSRSPYGPWERLDQPILEPRPGEWDGAMVTNPAPAVLPDGTVWLAYKAVAAIGEGIKNHMVYGMTKAPHWRGPYERVSAQPIFDFGEDHIEDAYLWKTPAGFEMIFKDMRGGVSGEKASGVHATSSDGIDWRVSESPRAYSRRLRLDTGEAPERGNVERPQLLIQDGTPTHLIFATTDGEAPWPFAAETFSIVVPLAPPYPNAQPTRTLGELQETP